MKKTRIILQKNIFLAARRGMLALGMSVILCISAMAMTTHAYGHFNHYGMAYLAEKEARAKVEKLTAQKENNTIMTNAKVVAEDKSELRYDHEKNKAVQKN